MFMIQIESLYLFHHIYEHTCPPVTSALLTRGHTTQPNMSLFRYFWCKSRIVLLSGGQTISRIVERHAQEFYEYFNHPETIQNHRQQAGDQREGQDKDEMIEKTCLFWTSSKMDCKGLGRCFFLAFILIFTLAVIFSVYIFSNRRTDLEYGLTFAIIVCVGMFLLFSIISWRKTVCLCISCNCGAIHV